MVAPLGGRRTTNPVLIWISLVVCMTGQCKVIVPDVEPVSSAVYCMVRGEQIAAQWIGEHAGWTLRRVGCSSGRKPSPQDDI